MVTRVQQRPQRAATAVLERPRHSRMRHRSLRPTGQRGNGKRAPAIERILVPLDGSLTTESILPFVETLAGRLEASLVLFRAIRPPPAMSPMPEGLAYLPDVMAFLEADAERYLERIADELAKAGLEASTMVAVESAESGIVGAASDVKADLVALATHGRSGVARWVMGSTADAVVRRAGVPCLVVRAEERAS